MDMLFCRVAKGDDFVSSSDFVRNGHEGGGGGERGGDQRKWKCSR